MRRDPATWHPQYLRQAAWTQAIRQRAWTMAGIAAAGRVLEVGSGTGAILADLPASTSATRFGLDLDLPGLRFHHGHDPSARLCGGDGSRLPFADGSFEVVYCHYLLLWVKHPRSILNEMTRVLCPAGWLMCLAEPDYGGRIDYPDPLSDVGKEQRQALRLQGADPDFGRRLRSLLADAGLNGVQAGVLGAEWSGAASPDEISAEWAVLRNDLRGLWTDARLAAVEQEFRAASSSGGRVLYVPTFFAFGRKPIPPRS